MRTVVANLRKLALGESEVVADLVDQRGANLPDDLVPRVAACQYCLSEERDPGWNGKMRVLAYHRVTGAFVESEEHLLSIPARI